MSIVIDNRSISPLTGRVVVPGDKSISHRAFFFAALNRGVTNLWNTSGAADCRSTLQLLGNLGYSITEWSYGVKFDGGMKWRRDADAELLLDCGNSGTTARLSAGFLTGERGRFQLTGDGSLARRPMGRIVEPLKAHGATIQSNAGLLPITIESCGEGIDRNSEAPIDVASAQVHGALVLAALRSQSTFYLRRIAPMRDHTLRMMRLFEVQCSTSVDPEHLAPIDIIRPVTIDKPISITIPGDVSSASFFVVAALLTPGSDIIIESVGLNPTRIAFLHCLKMMGADLKWQVTGQSEEPMGTIRARYTQILKPLGEINEHAPFNRGNFKTQTMNVAVEGTEAAISIAEMIDELPLLALVASQAVGTSVIGGARELRFKETDRIATTVSLLRSMGIDIDERADGFAVTGRQLVKGGIRIDHEGDHRLAMLGGVAGLIASAPIEVSEPEVVRVSYPGFWKDLAAASGLAVDFSTNY